MGARGIAVAAVLLGVAALGPSGPARAAPAEDPGALMDQFFATWDNNGNVTPATVASLYARRVSYYGQVLTTAGVYNNKRAFIRRWPDRRYTVVPGTVSKGCDAGKRHCGVSVVLAYTARSDARDATARGYTRVTLALAKEDGQFKITREQGRPVQRP